MKKERIFYLDFIRAISTFVIVLAHYNAIFCISSDNPKAIILKQYVSNLYIGAIGVSLFLIISGAAMTHVYESRPKVDWKKFYRKRFITIFPMFWIAYIIVGSIAFLEQKGINPSISKFKLIFSALGLDGYLLSFDVPTFMHVGEWFLGLILIIYIIFPLVLFAFKKFPKLLIVAFTLIYIISLFLLETNSLDKYTSIFPIMRLAEFIFGMYFFKYIKTVKWYAVVPSIAIIVLNQLLKPVFMPIVIQQTYVSVCFFIILVYISKFFKFSSAKNICSIMCKYSYACFIIHHYIIVKITFTFNLNEIGKFNSHILFIICCLAVAVASYFLNKINQKLVCGISNLFSKTKS